MLSTKAAFEMLKTSSALKKLKASSTLRMLRTKTALGIDISDRQISLALLKRSKNGFELLTSATAPVPFGAVKNGNIENVAILANTIKKLKKSNRIRTSRTAVSLFTKPVIVQIMGVPKQVPQNIGQFVQDQVKHVAVLPGNKIALDFCGVAGVGSETGPANRLLVVAADGRRVTDIVKVCNQAGLTVEAIEPPLLAYNRTLYAKEIAEKFDCNVLVAVLQDSTLNLCVFRKQTIDFVRTKSINKEKTQPDELCQWLAEQINMVVQFYDVDVPDNCGKWEITVVADCVQPLENTEGALRAKVTNADLKLLTSKDICRDAVVSQSGEPADCQLTDKPSPVAIGLAMKLLDTDALNLGVNLLPPEVVRLRTTQKETLITANIMAAVLLIMVLVVNGQTRKIGKLNERISQKKANLSEDTRALIERRAAVDKQIDDIGSKLDQINGISGSYRDTDWSNLLNDIRKRIPRAVCITNLSGVTNSGMSLKGLALSNEAVYLFADMLNKSEYISSASISETKRDKKNGFINYEISCALAPEKGKE